MGLAAAALGGAAVGSVTTGSLLGWSGPPAVDAQVRWAIDLQDGPQEQLLARHADFLAVFSTHPEDVELLMPGLMALVNEAARPDGIADQQGVARRICAAIAALRNPDEQLAEIARRLRNR
ncbi:MAG: hypothetical protein HZB39_06260 [Planctomycetes bacterium]|nr:hypothetical protein [Planctomycetota bacterium]